MPHPTLALTKNESVPEDTSPYSGSLHSGLRRLLALIVLIVPFLVGCGNASAPTVSVTTFQGMYIADTGNNRIVRIDDPAFVSDTQSDWFTAGTLGSGKMQFNHPSSVVVGHDFRLYIADTGNNRIVRMDNIFGDNWIEWGPPGELSQPKDICTDGSNIVYIADTGHNRIVRLDFNTLGYSELKKVGTYGNLNTPTGVDLLPRSTFGQLKKDMLVIADSGNNRILMTPEDLSESDNYRYGRSDGAPGNGTLEFNHPFRARISASGIHVADTGNNRSAYMEFDGGNWLASDPTVVPLANPLGTLVGYGGTYLADTDNNRIARVRVLAGSYPKGILEWSLGSLGSGIHQFDHPEGLFDGYERSAAPGSDPRVPTSVSVTPTTVDIPVGGTAQITGIGYNPKGVMTTDPNAWIWGNDDVRVISISNRGNPITVTGVGVGTAHIHGSYGDNHEVYVTVNVHPGPGGITVPIK